MPLCKDAITGEAFNGIYVGTYGEQRLYSVRNEYNEEKLFFGPLDNCEKQKKRFKQWKLIGVGNKSSKR